MRDETSNVFYAFEHFSALQELRKAVSELNDKVNSETLSEEHGESLTLSIYTLHKTINASDLHRKSRDEYKDFISDIRRRVLNLESMSLGISPLLITELSNLATKLSESLTDSKFQAVMYHLKIIHLFDVYNDFSASDLKEKYYTIYKDILGKSETAESSLKDIEDAVQKVELEKARVLKQIRSASVAVVDAATTEIGQEITKEFRQTAADEMKSANRYRNGAMLCFFCSVVVLAINACNGSLPIDFAELLYKAGPVLFFTIPAFYLAKESASHRADYRKYKHLALNLPIGIKYIDALDDQSRHLVQAEFAKHLLIYNDISSSHQNADAKQFNDQLDKLGTILSEFKSAVEKIPKP